MKAHERAEAALTAALHVAHIEFAKAQFALAYDFSIAPTMRDVDLARRFLRNGLGLLDQFDPLTGEESLAAHDVTQQLHSDAPKERAQGEKAQAAIEKALVVTSQTITRATGEANAADRKSQIKDQQLRIAFDRENALANQMRNWKFGFFAAVAGVLILSLLAIYVRLQLSGVGAALNLLPSGTAGDVVKALDKVITSKPAQAMVRRGRVLAAAAAEAAAAKLSGEKDQTATTAPSTS